MLSLYFPRVFGYAKVASSAGDCVLITVVTQTTPFYWLFLQMRAIQKKQFYCAPDDLLKKTL
ncbi:hypothetical protein A7985_11800 [Pseudoalteromonas luteoviolacea]|uniref:Uncharacterized protein n=1 Tax=Pseudoalteromonas luteoviolacea TaxID=43657 RepID=A0A1C0TQR9_9GAMM|nr:hypothetical protein A7985_11800 [Pseudoalteromonas luteoviolacea]